MRIPPIEFSYDYLVGNTQVVEKKTEAIKTKPKKQEKIGVCKIKCVKAEISL